MDFISAKLDQGLTCSQASSALLDACLANDPKEARGVGCDNMTSVVVQLKHDQVGPGGVSKVGKNSTMVVFRPLLGIARV